MNAKSVVPWVIAIALFMETLDTTIITTAIPTMAQTFGVEPLALKFALTSYLLSLALFIPISGWVADKWGAQRTFVFALIVFTLSSIGCGIATGLTELVVARVVQGLGGAFMMPVGRLIILRTFPKNELIQAMNFVAMPALLGPLLGPLVGGFITTYYSWPWIFYINVPMGLLGIVLALRYIENSLVSIERKFDVTGFLTFGLSLVGLFFAFEAISLHSISTFVVVLIFVASVLGFLYYYWHYNRIPNPLLNLKLLALRTFSIAAIGNVWARLGLSSISFVWPLLFQIGYGVSPFESGLLLSAFPLGAICSKPINKMILARWGFRRMLCVTSLLIGGILVSFSFIKTFHISLIVIHVFASGFLASLQYTGMNMLYYLDVKTEEMSHATSIASTLQQVSMGFGIVLSALLVQYFIGWNQSLILGDILPFRYTLFTMGVVVLVSALVFLRLKSTDGQEVT